MKYRNNFALGYFFAFLLGMAASLGSICTAAMNSLPGWFYYILIAVVLMIDSTISLFYLLRPCRYEDGYRSYKGRLLITFCLAFVLSAALCFFFFQGTVLYEEKEMLPYLLSYIIYGGIGVLACLLAPGFSREDDESPDGMREDDSNAY